MTAKECIALVDEVKPNAFTDPVKLMWLSTIEARIASEIFLMGDEELEQFRYTEATKDHELLLSLPWDDIYIAYLTAKADSKNGEFNRLSTTAQAFNRKWNELAAHVGNVYQPANGYYFPKMERGEDNGNV